MSYFQVRLQKMANLREIPSTQHYVREAAWHIHSKRERNALVFSVVLVLREVSLIFLVALREVYSGQDRARPGENPTVWPKKC